MLLPFSRLDKIRLIRNIDKIDNWVQGNPTRTQQWLGIKCLGYCNLCREKFNYSRSYLIHFLFGHCPEAYLEVDGAERLSLLVLLHQIFVVGVVQLQTEVVLSSKKLYVVISRQCDQIRQFIGLWE